MVVIAMVLTTVMVVIAVVMSMGFCKEVISSNARYVSSDGGCRGGGDGVVVMAVTVFAMMVADQ